MVMENAMEMKKVRAIERGFYFGIREIGDVFNVPADFDAPWFVRDVIVVAAPPDVTLEQLTESVKDSAPPELGHVEMVGHGENGAPLWEPLPEPTPAEATPETPTKPGKGKRG